MDSTTYNILWIDDEHEKLKGIHMTALDHGIKLTPFKSFDGGIGELERNYTDYDGVLLDAKFFMNESDTPGSEDINALKQAKDRLLQLPKKFELFVLTGQAQLFDDETFNTFFPKYYRKGLDKDIEQLFSDLRKAADEQPDTQIRHEYQRVFDVCTEKYIGELAGKDILDIFREKDNGDVNKYLVTIRKVVEDIFKGFYKFKLLPPEFVIPNVELNKTSKFLSGEKENGYQLRGESQLPEVMSNYLRFILQATQPGAHRSNVDKHIREVNTTYLFNSLLYQLLDIIIWFKIYVNSNPQTENWVTDEVSELIHGRIINVDPSGKFAFLETSDGVNNIYIPASLVKAYDLAENIEAAVEIEEYLDNRTNEVRTRAKRIEIK